jgi:hypothetical protein
MTLDPVTTRPINAWNKHVQFRFHMSTEEISWFASVLEELRSEGRISLAQIQKLETERQRMIDEHARMVEKY